jgi:energy-coupling factor transport system ATP-binding protein
MVFQIPMDQIVATIAQEDVAFGPENLGVPQPELGRRVREAMERVGAWEWRDRPPHMLSPGQQQRLAIAGALAMKPDCLVLDEATAMLDPRGRRDLWAIVEGLRGEGGHGDGLTILFITHDMDEAARADRVVVLHQGHVALDGPPRVVFGDPGLSDLGLGRPVLGELIDLVAERGLSLDPRPSTPRELASALLELQR